MIFSLKKLIKLYQHLIYRLFSDPLVSWSTHQIVMNQVRCVRFPKRRMGELYNTEGTTAWHLLVCPHLPRICYTLSFT